MLLSRTKGDKEKAKGKSKKDKGRKKKNKPKVDDYLTRRDYTGAITLLEFNKKRKFKKDGTVSPDLLLWLGFCYFHNSEFDKAYEVYKEMMEDPNVAADVYVYAGCCKFYLGDYQEAWDLVEKGPSMSLRNRLLFHISHKFGDEEQLMHFHSHLQDVTEDQLCLASIHYLRGHYNEAIEIYKRLQREHKDFHALNVYMAMCFYKLDFYDVSQQVLALYLSQVEDSAIAINLKACNHFRLYDGRAAETELKRLHEISSPHFKFGQDIVSHNMVVFRSGENALQVLPPLIDVLPEARLNLVIYYLHNDEIEAAFDLMKDVEAISPQEYILKGVVHVAYGQTYKSPDHIKLAEQLFRIVGSSSTECDTIPGRQCMASCLFILEQFEDVLIYLNSIKSYFFNDSDFLWNYGIARASTGYYADAEEALLNITNEKYKQEFCYQAWLSRCYIMNGKPQLAWDLYVRMETSTESFNLLLLIANDCYRMGHFFVAARAFDILERSDPNPDYLDGKRGACVGLFQQIVAGTEPHELLTEVIAILRNSVNPQIELIVATMKSWAKSEHIPI